MASLQEQRASRHDAPDVVPLLLPSSESNLGYNSDFTRCTLGFNGIFMGMAFQNGCTRINSEANIVERSGDVEITNEKPFFIKSRAYGIGNTPRWRWRVASSYSFRLCCELSCCSLLHSAMLMA